LSRSSRSLARVVLHVPGVRAARRATELAVTPKTRVELIRLDDARGDLSQRLGEHAHELEQLGKTVADIEGHLPAVLNAITSMSGAARVAKREVDALRVELECLRREFETFSSESSDVHHQQAADIADVRAQVAHGDLDVLGQIRPHVETLGWLMNRVETVRFEMLNELRYGKQPDGRPSLEPRVVNPEALDRARLRLNIGAGHIALEGYVNVDMRELPGIDVIATVDDLPFEPGTVDEIFSSHTLEHFPQEVLRRQLLPYWVSLLKPRGTLGVVAPDVEAMTEGFVRGDTSFEDFREVLYGAQEYEGDTHFTGFTPDSCCALLLEAGLVDPVIVARDRPNGKCKEFEITARKAE
jgi:hypothetical protein